MDFENRVAVVTGGTGALGSTVVLDLLAAGARVAVTYRSEPEWSALEQKAAVRRPSLLAARVDLSRSGEVDHFVAESHARWGRVDFLLAIAGGFAAGKSHETAAQGWQHMLELNLTSLLNALRATVPLMVRQNFGRIITVSSGSILHGGGAGIAAYAVSKGAVRHLTEILADELKAYDIRVHCLLPGTIDTEANRRAMPNADFSRWVTTEDVARVIHFLLSDQSRALRSVVIPVLG